VAAEFDRAPLGTRQQFATKAAPAQFGMDPENSDEQPVGIGRADEPGHDLAAPVADKKADPREAGIAENLAIVRVGRVADRIAILLRSPILEAQPESRGQVHRTPCVANANSD
jgi:hypothetical protein